MDAFLERKRPPIHIRPELDIGYRLSADSIEVFEIRPQWNDPSVIREHPVAKVRFVMKAGRWTVYSKGSDLKWHIYEPVPFVDSLDIFIEILIADEFACFWG